MSSSDGQGAVGDDGSSGGGLGQARVFQVVVDCQDADRMARFWAEALGYAIEPPPTGSDDWMDYQVRSGFPAGERVEFAAISNPNTGARVCFMVVPEPKQGKNRLHLDIRASERGSNVDAGRPRIDALVSQLCDSGASAVRATYERGHYYVTMTDIEGNEFCVH